MIARCGGPSDARASGNTVRFPRQGDESNGNTVTITAPKAVAEKIRAELLKDVASLKSRVVWGVVVPRTLHPSVIGKGASALQELQRKHGVKIIMPGWNDWATTGEVANPEDVKGATPDDLVKLVGPREATIAAAADLSVRPLFSPFDYAFELVTDTSQFLQKGRPNQASATHTIQVPKKFHAKIAQGGRFFRSLPTGTRVTHDGAKPPSSSVKTKKPPAPTNGAAPAAPAARIDDEAGAAPVDIEVLFQLVPLYDEAQEDESEIPWVIESASQEDADKVLAEIEKSLAQAKSSTHVGWLTVPRGLSELLPSPSYFRQLVLTVLFSFLQCRGSSVVAELDWRSFAREESRSTSSGGRTRTVLPSLLFRLRCFQADLDFFFPQSSPLLVRRMPSTPRTAPSSNSPPRDPRGSSTTATTTVTATTTKHPTTTITSPLPSLLAPHLPPKKASPGVRVPRRFVLIIPPSRIRTPPPLLPPTPGLVARFTPRPKHHLTQKTKK